MKPDPVERPSLRLVDAAAPPRPVPRAAPPKPPAVSLLARMIEAAEPGDVEAILVGMMLGVLLIAGIVVADNLALIEAWLHG